jgi:hypothetical protein
MSRNLPAQRCGNCATAWHLGVGTNSHVVVCDRPAAETYRRCLVPNLSACASWLPEGGK